MNEPATPSGWKRSSNRVRVHELARELGIDSKTVLARLAEFGEYVKTASSTVELPVADRVRASFGGGGSDARRIQTPRRPAVAPIQPSGAIPTSRVDGRVAPDGDWFRQAASRAAHSPRRGGRWTKVGDLSPMARVLLPELWRGRPTVPADVVAAVNERSREWAIEGFTEHTAALWRCVSPKAARYLANRKVDPLILDQPIWPPVGSGFTWADGLNYGFLQPLDRFCARLAEAGHRVEPEPAIQSPTFATPSTTAAPAEPAAPPVASVPGLFSHPDGEAGAAPSQPTWPPRGAARRRRRPSRNQGR